SQPIPGQQAQCRCQSAVPPARVRPEQVGRQLSALNRPNGASTSRSSTRLTTSRAAGRFVVRAASGDHQVEPEDHTTSTRRRERGVLGPAAVRLRRLPPSPFHECPNSFFSTRSDPISDAALPMLYLSHTESGVATLASTIGSALP